MAKKEMTPQDTYKRNQKRAKLLKIFAPITFWAMIVLGIICFIVAVKNSFGNIIEISQMLDDKNLTGEQLTTNYNILLDRYGEWVIGDGSKGFQMAFVNIKRALFSGVMITMLIFSIILVVGAFVIGKWLMPKLSQQVEQNNQDMVNLTILENSKEK